MDKRTEEMIDLEEIYYCFRCGYISYDYVDEGLHKCDKCGKWGYISFNTGIDIINDLYLKGYMDEILHNYINDDDMEIEEILKDYE